jgi:hypothetical protein
MNKAVCNRSTLIKKGRVFELYAENVTLPNGEIQDAKTIAGLNLAAVRLH